MANPGQAALLGTFQKHIEDMRSLVHCKICLKPFYEPFTLSCGHTYCYSCLSSWIGGSQQREKNKNCPDCRTVITHEPCPNYTLRDLVHMFCNRVELLPEDETLQEHQAGKHEEAQALAADRSGRGLFKGVFSRRLLPGPLGRPQFIRDEEDGGILRCPFCAHEIVGGICTNEGCGFGLDGRSDYTEEDLDSETGGLFTDILRANGLAPNPFGFEDIDESDGDSNSAGVRSGPYASEDEDDEDDSEMNDFIDDDEDHDLPEEDDQELGYEEDTFGRPEHPAFRSSSAYSRTSDIASQRDYSEGSEHDYNHFSGDHIETESDGYESGHVPHNPARATAYPIDYDSETSHDHRHTYHEAEGSVTEQQTDYDNDDDGSSVREISPPINSHVRRPKRRIIDSDDEENDGSEGAQLPDEGADSDNAVDATEAGDSEESEDTAIRPPQSSAARRQRLERQRTSRNGSRETGSRRRAGGGRLYPVINLPGCSSERPSATSVY